MQKSTYVKSLTFTPDGNVDVKVALVRSDEDGSLETPLAFALEPGTDIDAMLKTQADAITRHGYPAIDEAGLSSIRGEVAKRHTPERVKERQDAVEAREQLRLEQEAEAKAEHTRQAEVEASRRAKADEAAMDALAKRVAAMLKTDSAEP